MVRGREKFLTQAYVLADTLLIVLSFILSWYIKFKSGLFEYEGHLGFTTYGSWVLVYSGFAIASGYLFSLYIPKRKKKFAYEVGKVIQVHVFSMLFLLSFLFLYKEVDISRFFLALFLGLNIIFIVSFRLYLKLLLKRFRAKGYNKHFVLILGAGQLGRKFHDSVLRRPEMGYDIIGFLDDFLEAHDEEYKPHYKPILGTVDKLSEILESDQLVDEVIIALPLRAHDKYKKIIGICEKAGVKTLIIPDFYDYLPAEPS